MLPQSDRLADSQPACTTVTSTTNAHSQQRGQQEYVIAQGNFRSQTMQSVEQQQVPLGNTPQSFTQEGEPPEQLPPRQETPPPQLITSQPPGDSTALVISSSPLQACKSSKTSK